MGEVDEIDGVGNTAKEQLEGVGITTVNQLANASLEDLEEAGVRAPDKILNRAQKQGVQIQSGEEVEEEQSNSSYVSTGMQSFDNILGGGLQGGFLIGLSGEHKAGKTQFAMQTLATAADTTDGHAVYIETEPNRFQVDRVKSLCRKDDSYKRIHRIQAYSPDETVDNLRLQRNAYEAVRDNFDNVSIVVVDSFVANFRLSNKFEGRGDLKKRSNIIGNHLSGLQGLANDLDCPVLITLQVYGNPSQYDHSVPIWGGALMHHTITCLIHMSHAKGELREAQLKGHPGEPDKEVTLKIPENAPIEAME